MDSVEIQRAEIVALINAKYDKKAEKEPLPQPKVWIKEELNTADITVKKVIKETPKTKQIQQELF